VTKRTTRHKPDPLERGIELALSPGYFVGDRSCTSFVSELEEAESGIEPLIESAPDRAIALYETFLAGCYAKAEEVDDSSGSFGMFVEDLFCKWVGARQAAGSPPEETTAQLLAWMDDDPYGFCYGFETKVSSVLDKAGLAALVAQVRERFESASSSDDEQIDRESSYERRHWSEVLRSLYIGQKDVSAYVALVEQTGVSAKDCHAVATLLIAKRKREEALSWVERGIGIATKDPRSSYAGYELRNMRRDLLRALGRGTEALDSAWSEFAEHPSIHSYGELMKFVPKVDRETWHARAIDAAARADLYSLLGLLVETKETERLKEVVGRSTDEELEDVSHYALQPAAERLERTHPAEAARLWQAMGLRIVNAGKSKYYGAALGNFEKAKRCYEKAGLTARWEEVVEEVRSEHRRKTGFMPGFEKIVSGRGSTQEPPFLERAKARWAKTAPPARRS
jgi:tetratricopeptide (TPR) repeat protein